MKLDIETLRKAVNQKLISEDFESGFHEPVMIHQGSHTLQHGMNHGYEEESHEDEEREMIKQNLFQLSVYAAKLHDLMEQGCESEEWVQEKIVEATSKISDVYHYLEYQNYKKSM